MSPLIDPENSIFLHEQAFGAPFVYYYCLTIAPEHFSISFIIHFMSPGVCYRPNGDAAGNIQYQINNSPLPCSCSARRKKLKVEARSDCLFRYE